MKYEFKGTLPANWKLGSIEKSEFGTSGQNIDFNNGYESCLTYWLRNDKPTEKEMADINLILSAHDLLNACKKALDIFTLEANAGRYPKTALVEFGGEGLGFLTNAINKALNKEETK